MFKLFYKIVLLFLIFVIINIGTLLYFDKFDIYYPPFKNKFNFFIHRDQYQNFILGDSRVESGVNPQLFKEKTVNLGLPGIGLYSATKALLQSGVDLKDKNIILGIGVLNLNDNRIHKRFLALMDDFLYQSIPFMFRSWGRHSIENLNAVYACKFFSCPYFNNLSQTYLVDTNGYLAKTDKITDPQAGEKAFLDRFYVYYQNFYVRGTLYRTFQESVKILKSNGARVSIVMFPNAPNYREILRKEKREADFNQLLISVGQFAKNEQIPFLSYVDRSDLFSYPDFADVMHLNEQGATKFTRLLIHDLSL